MTASNSNPSFYYMPFFSLDAWFVEALSERRQIIFILPNQDSKMAIETTN